MIIISVYGGIGNQMFQYALGKSLSNILNEKVKYEYSYNLTRTDFNPADIDSIFNIFDLSGELASQKEIQYFKGPQNINIKILAKLFQKTHKFFYKKRRKIFFEESSCFNEKVFEFSGDYYLNGYWQSERYFVQIKNTILNEFKFKLPSDEKLLSLTYKIQQTESVSVHLRGRDYLSKSYHFTCDISYYKKCFDHIKKKVKDPHFFIFSDDPDWAKRFIQLDGEYTFVDINKWNKSSIEDMRLMSMCKYNIIANSSFSWWAAWLNVNPNKLILAPKKWFNSSKVNTEDLVPDSWIRI